MRLSALDIKKKEFQQKMRGADPEEVQAFLNNASEEVETLTREKREAEDRLKEVQDVLNHYLSMEQTLERTLVAAQQTALKMEEQAKKEAELILKEAELEREKKLGDIRMDLDRSRSEVLHLNMEYESTLARMRTLISGFERFITSLEQDKTAAMIAKSTAAQNGQAVPLAATAVAPAAPAAAASGLPEDPGPITA